MKNFFFILFFSLFFTNFTFATSGGPGPIVEKLTIDGDIIYIQTDSLDGRGCAKELSTLDINSSAIKYLFSWEDIRKKDLSCEEVEKSIQKLIPKSAIPLKEVNLKKIPLSVEFQHLFDESLRIISDPDFDALFYPVPLQGNVFVDKQKISTLFINQCMDHSTNINIRGYSLPSKDFIFLVPTYIGQCFESGYLSEDFFFIPQVKISENAFLDSVFNPIAPEGVSNTEFCCPLGTTVFPSSGGQFRTVLPFYKALNNKGFEEYQKGNYKKAIEFFHVSCSLSQSISRTNPYLMPCFNLAATLSKTGEYEEALKNIQIILSSKDEKFIEKIFTDSDFEPIKEKIFFLYLQTKYEYFKKYFWNF